MSDSENSVSQSDIAIVGMGLRVPGARSVAEFWNNLRGGVESIETRTTEQLLAAGESAERMRRKNYVPRTAELPGLESFDAEFFGFSPKEAAIMDPQHRQFLECAWEALEDSTCMPDRSSGPVGVFAGCGMGSYFYFNVLSHRSLVDKVGMFLLRHTGNDKDFLATRASYLFDLHGPSVNVQTACSTSLVAVHYACQSLLGGECAMAIAGGVTIDLPHRRGYLYQDGEILSTDGHCRAFDHRASGTVFGSGVGAVVLKRLSDAIADGDPIHAVIKATAINNDGAAKAGYLAPSVTGQAEAIVEAQALAGVEADSIGYVECHGTGTYLGDPIEIEALTQAFRQTTDKRGFCRVGSVKSNIGHLDTAAGVVSLIKATLAVKHGEMPPTLGFEKPNPAIEFATSPFVVNDRLTPWPASQGPRRAGVNSLGVGGTNAHAVIEQAPQIASAEARGDDANPQVLVLAAKNRKALDDFGRRIGSYIEANESIPLQDVARTLLEGRRHFEHRRVLAVSDRKDAVALLSDPSSKRAFTHSRVDNAPEAVFLFSGGGAQYPHMARDLYHDEPTFKTTVDEGLSYLPAAVAQEIRGLWLPAGEDVPDAAERLLRPSLQLPAILIVEIAIARLWMSWGVKPTALIGHSMGENAAACVAGVLSFERAVNLVRLRGELFEEVPPGGMLSVGLSHDALKARLPADLDIASINGPELCVVSGANAALDAFRESLAADGIDASRIPIDIAAHSRMLQPILQRFEDFLRATPLSAPNIPIVSNLTGTWLTAAEARDPAYWAKHLRSTVQFAVGMNLLSAQGSRIFVEVGPGRVLGSLAKAQGIPANQVINSLPHADEHVNDNLHFLAALGRAWATGLAVPLERLYASSSARRISLPTYAFQHQSYFLEHMAGSGDVADEAVPTKLPDIAQWGWQPVWKRSLADVSTGADTKDGSYLVFHDGSSLGDDLVMRLRQRGHSVSTVRTGDAFGIMGDGDYVLCPEHGRDGYDALLKQLAAVDALPQHIVHLWLTTHDESFRPGSSFFHRNLELGFQSLFFLAQSLSDVGQSDPLRITVVTNGMQRVGNEALAYPEKATVLGPAQVLPREMPNISVRVVDIPLDASSTFIARQTERVARALLRQISPVTNEQTALDHVWDEVLASAGNEIVAYRSGHRWTQGQGPLSLDASSDAEAGFRQRGVYLVTGGLGALGSAIAEDMAERFKARLILISRTAMPDRAEWQSYLAAYGDHDRIGRAIAAVKRIEAAGGEVMIASGDITNSDFMRGVIAQGKARFGAINGVLHAAGIVSDDLIALKSQSEIDDVFAPKLLGTLVLSDLLKDEPLDLFVLFSSTSTDIAPAGQVDYVAANAFLNAFAEARAKSTQRTVAVHWGVWKDIGIAARAVLAAERNEAAPMVEATRGHLFDRHVRGEKGDWLEARVDSNRHWVLDEHRLKSGHAIWPGTGYLELIAQALAEKRVQTPYEIDDLTFLRPLYVPEGEASVVRVNVSTDSGDYRLSIDSEQAQSLMRHAEAGVRAVPFAKASVLDIAAILARCPKTTEAGVGDALRSAQEDHLRFGARWKVLRSTAFGQSEALAKLSLSDAFVPDLENGYLLHPALLDIATGYAMDLIDGYDPAATLWVPMTYSRLRVYGALPASVWSHVRLDPSKALGPDYATFDVTIADEEGRVIVDVQGFTVRQLPAGIDLAASLSDASASKAVQAASSATSDAELSPGQARLAAQVDQGILPEEGFDALLRALKTGKAQVIVSSMDLPSLQRAASQTEVSQANSTAFDRPDIGVDFVEPQSEYERTLAGFWSELLGVKRIGVHDSFFDLGGHSLIAVRLFRKIKAAYAVDFPISTLFEAPTIAQCAALIERTAVKTSPEGGESQASNAAAEAPRFTHLVRMDSGKDRARKPFFLCAGMFGNILNLRHLAVQVGADRPVYGLQARGIYGGQAPHETFEDMARDYLAEVRAVQPHGPYLLGGFSGGGLVAYEMAQQLRAEGEETGLLVMLDTPYPDVATLSVQDRVMMKLQDLNRGGFAAIEQWVRKRIEWELRRNRAKSGPAPKSAEQFHNEEIEAAFRRALARYRGQPYAGPVLLARPKPDVAYTITGGRQLTSERDLVRPDNGWTPYAANLDIREVPGDHDSMVLEPNVRVLAGHLREELTRADRFTGMRQIAAE